MGFSLSFKNVGHFFASGFKYIAVGIKDVVLVANKSQAVAPEVEAFVGLLAGPAAVRISDLAFHVLGSTAAALQKVGTDAAAVAGAGVVNLTLDAQVVADIKAASAQIEAIVKSVGGVKPTV